MITREVKKDGVTIVKETMEAMEPMITPGYRARAAALVAQRLIDEGVPRATVFEHPEVLQAARDAKPDGFEIMPGCTQKNRKSVVVEAPAPAEQAEEFDDDDADDFDDVGDVEATEAAVDNLPEIRAAIKRRYLLSIVNQRRESFDDLENAAIYDMLNHPRFANLPVCSYEQFEAAAVNRMKNNQE